MSYNALRKGRYSETGRAYFVTTVTENRQRWFEDFTTARILAGQMRRLYDDGDVHSLAWVIMPDHLHWLFQLREGADLSATVKRLKARSAYEINRSLNRRGVFWQKAFHDHALRDDEDTRRIARYIVANPLRVGLVTEIGDYPHWDAIWLDEDGGYGSPFD